MGKLTSCPTKHIIQVELELRFHRNFLKNGDPGRTRTPNLLIRSQLLYPVELRNHAPWNEDIILISLISSAQFCASFSNESPVAGGPVLPT